MKRFISVVIILVMVLSMAACSGVGSKPEDSAPIVYTGELTVTKLEVFYDTGDYRYIMAVENDDVSLLFRVNSSYYLKYDIGDVVSGEVKGGGPANYYVRLDENDEWLYVLETIGLEG